MTYERKGVPSHIGGECHVCSCRALGRGLCRVRYVHCQRAGENTAVQLFRGLSECGFEANPVEVVEVELSETVRGWGAQRS